MSDHYQRDPKIAVDAKMETRKKRATELIEKCDVKIFSTTERTQIVQIYDRRVKIDLSESVLDNTSLYSVLRSWVQDDPDKHIQHIPDDIRVRKKLCHVATISSDEEPITVAAMTGNEANWHFSLQTKEENFERQLSAHVRNFKQVRHRSMLLSANRYARSISSLDAMKIPRLLMMERILKDQEEHLSSASSAERSDEHLSAERSEEEYSSSFEDGVDVGDL